MSRMQLNGKESKKFRDILAQWHIATFKLSDAICKKQKNIKAIQTMIESDNEILEKVLNGESTLKTEQELLAEIKMFEEKIEGENTILANLRAEVKEDIAKGRELVDANLLGAITDYLGDIHNDDLEEQLLSVIVDWFKNNGINSADMDNVKPYIRALGQKKASARAMAKTSKHNAIPSKVAMTDIFLGAICDEPSMNKMLPLYKWETIIEKKTKNK